MGVQQVRVVDSITFILILVAVAHPMIHLHTDVILHGQDWLLGFLVLLPFIVGLPSPI